MKKTLILLLIFVLCAAVLVACDTDGDGSAAVQNISVTARGLSDGVLTLSEGDEVMLSPKAEPSSYEGGFSFASADPSVATVSGSGVVKGIAAGETTITVSGGGVSVTITAKVETYVPVTSIVFADGERTEIGTGVRKQLVYSVLPEDASTKNLNFSVTPENSGVTVTSAGVVEVADSVVAGSIFTITATAARETSVSASIEIEIATYELEDIKIVSNDFYTEITELTVPLDEPYRVLFQMAVPEKAIPVGEAIPTEWTSSDESVVTVNEKGRLTFHSVGNAVITMSAMGITKDVNVTVTEPCGDFIGDYYLPADYISQVPVTSLPTADGWHVWADFREGGTGSEDARNFVLANYKYFTGPSSWFAGGGYCIEMGGWDNIHSGLEDDDTADGGLPNLYMWTKVTLGAEATSVRAHFEYRQSDATFKYKLRFTAIDTEDGNKVYHFSPWQTGAFATDPNLSAGESFIEADVPEEIKGKTVLLLLEYDDIDFPTDGILNGVESVNIKYFSVLNYDGMPIENSLWVLGDDIISEDYTGSLVNDLGEATGYTVFRDTINESTVMSNAGSGIVDRIDSGYYAEKLGRYGAPKKILIQRGTHDLYSYFMGDVQLGDAASTDVSTVAGAIRYVLKNLTSLYPDAEIIWCTPIYRYDVDEEYAANYIEVLKTICAEFNVEVFDLYNEIGISAENSVRYLNDGIHLNVDGRQLMLDELSQAVGVYS